MRLSSLAVDLEQAFKRLGLKYGHWTSEQEMGLLLVNLRSLRLNFRTLTPFFLLPPNLATAEPKALAALVRESRVTHGWLDRPCFLLLEWVDGRDLLPEIGPHDMLVVLGIDDTRRLLAAPSLTAELAEQARAQLPRRVLSPYETSQPVVGGAFFGRESEINAVLTHPTRNCLFLGMRRVGKTSLLKEIKRRSHDEFDTRPNEALDISIFVDCSAQSVDNLLYTILERISPRFVQRYQPDRFVHQMRLASHGGKHPVQLFLDEIDEIVRQDQRQDWFVINQLRATANEGYARYLFAGDKLLHPLASDADTPFFNFAELVSIGPFTPSVARQLIRDPLGQLGITISEQLVNQVLEQSGCHPNILQFYCKFFVERLDEERRDEVQPEDVTDLIDDPGFDAFVMGNFEVNTSLVERLLILLTMQKAKFTLSEVDEILKQADVYLLDHILRRALSNLRIAGILEYQGLDYSLKIPVLRTLVERQYDRDYLIQHLRQEHPDAFIRGL